MTMKTKPGRTRKLGDMPPAVRAMYDALTAVAGRAPRYVGALVNGGAALSWYGVTHDRAAVRGFTARFGMNGGNVRDDARTRAALLAFDPPAEFRTGAVSALVGCVTPSYPILADALADAGCADDAALAVMRTGFAPDAPRGPKRPYRDSGLIPTGPNVVAVIPLPDVVATGGYTPMVYVNRRVFVVRTSRGFYASTTHDRMFPAGIGGLPPGGVSSSGRRDRHWAGRDSWLTAPVGDSRWPDEIHTALRDAGY